MTLQEPLSASQARLQDDLLGLIKGDVRCDDVIRQVYCSDGSLFEELPRAVVWPKSAQDVVAVVKFAREKNLSIHPRGAGTSAAASSIGSGIILDFSRYMRRMLHVGDGFIRVQPGAIRERVNDQLRVSNNAFFAPSAGHVPTSAIGSILSVDNIGPRWLRYGSPHESVLELKVVLADGSIETLRPFASSPSFSRSVDADASRRRFLNAALAEANAVAAQRSPDAPKFDPEFDAQLEASLAGRSPSPEFGHDFNDGFGLRSFRSDFVRDEYFLRAFGPAAQDLRKLLRIDKWAATLRVIRQYESSLDAELGGDAPCRCGYALRDVVRNGFDPTRLFTGSEGTLGVIVEATLATFTPPPSRSSTILLFDSLDQAVRAVPTVLEFDPTLCDLLDSRVITLTRDWDARFEEAFPQGSEAALVVELDGTSDRNVRRRMNELQRVAREKLGSFGAWLAFTRENLDLFRDLLRRSSCARMRVSTEFQPFPFWDDVQVPVAAIPEFLRDAQSLLQKGRLVYSVGGHVGAGQLSIQPILPYSVDEERCALALSDNFENLVLKYGGEIGSARGNGRVRTAALTKRFPKLSRAFVAIKDVLDPENMFNPDCVVSPEMRRYAAQDRDAARGADALSALDEDALLAPEADAALRESSLHSRAIRRRTSFVSDEFPSSPSSSRSRRQLEYQLAWDPRVIIEPLRQCNGCGHCRIRTSETRLCPAFRNTPEEESSCRAKANLLRGAADGSLPLETLTRDGAVEFGLRCLRCHNCATECPAQVDAARLAFRLRSAAVAAKGLGFPELCASRLENTLRVASAFAPLSNQMLKTWFGRRWLRRILGVAEPRRVPKLLSSRERSAVARKFREHNAKLAAESSSFDAASAPAVKKSKPKVSLVVDVFERFFDTKLAEAAIEVLERNGIAVRVLERPRNVGIPSYALGDLDRARELANRNVATLREAMRNGSTIVALEPATAACVVKDYPYFCNDADAKKVYENTTDLCGYLASLDARGEFNRDDLKAIPGVRRVGYHAPCASLALSRAALPSPTYAQNLLGMIPELEVRRIERGCCGFACFSGFTKRRYYESLRLGSRLFLAARRPEFSLCASECSFCNIQLTQALAARAATSAKRKREATHVVKMLAVSYGAMSLEDAILETLAPIPTRNKYSP
ncbi:MAG: FAD-binding and (Fe-S)-binding domain-containing protein [Thermoguttaceae bacterium]